MKTRKPILKEDLSRVMNWRFDRYTKSIILQRAIPDSRDGLKPVQRRILFAMWKTGNTVDKAYRKSAKAVGDVMGKLHPHGDSSIYEALIHMSQNWKMRLPLIDLHGNNGSIDDDPPAAMRYTEARLSKASNEMMRDITKDTVHWVLNFDETEYEPTVLPSRFPNLIINGATGISSGYATQIPPHNLGETIDAVIYLMKHPNASLDKIMQFIKGPDFPTGGVVQGLKGLKKAYETGRGKVILRARHRITKLRGGRHKIDITQIPYKVNKKQLVHQINRIAINHNINGIEEVRDDSDRHGLSIVIITKRNIDPYSILDYLYKRTNLQIFYHFNVVAIDHMKPKTMSLISLLKSYLGFQRQIVHRRTQYDLNQIKARQEIVRGYIKALSLIDKIVQLVRTSHGRKNASDRLVKKLHFTTRQANAIVALRLYRLTNTNSAKLKREDKSLTKHATYCKQILDDPKLLDKVLRKELRQIKKEYNTPRRTSIENQVRKLHISKQVTIPNEDVIVSVSHDGYLKRSSLRSYSSSQTNGGLRPGDYLLFKQHMNTRDHLLIFTNLGRVIYRPINSIKEVRWKDTGTNVSQSIQMKPNEQIITVFSFKSKKDNGQFVMESSDGFIKRTSLKEILPGRTYRHHAPSYMKLNKHATIANVLYLPKGLVKSSVMLLTNHGFAERLALSDIPENGTNARGSHSINLHKGDSVIGMQIVNNNSLVATVNNSGNVNIFHASTAPLTKRNRRGNRIMYHLSTIPNIVGLSYINLVNTNQPMHIYTQVRRQQDFIPSQIGLVPANKSGKKVLKVSKLGRPARMSY